MKRILLSILTITAFSAGVNAQTFTDSLLSSNSTNARSIVSADIDGDGDLDLLTAAQGTAELAWFENTDGLGSFGPKIIIANVSTIYMALAGDMDADGDLDVIVISNGADRIIWYENTNGAGTFSTGTIITTLTNGGTSIDITDIDGDGDLDVVSTSYLDSKLAYYLNDGLGVFGPQVIISSMSGAIFVSAADMDNDGDMDLLAAASLGNKVSYFENNGAGVFATPVTISTTASAVTSVIASDINGDSNLDVLVSYSGNDKIVWFANTNGTGIFGAEQIISSVADRPFKVDAADLDNDGDMDVLSANFNDGEIVWYENTNGAGSFGAAQVISTVAQGASFVSTADIDADGDVDVFSASYSNHNFNFYRNSLISVGVNESKTTTMNISPNPTKGLLNINTTEKVEQVTIYSISGSLVKNINQNVNQVNVQELTKGLYILVVKTENGITRNRFIKE